MARLATMYLYGKGKDKDLNKAASIATEAINKSPDYPYSYYILGATLLDLHRYDESITNIQECLKKTDNNEEKSDAYNVLGLAYEDQQDYANAKEYYNQAIQRNSNNQYAKTNLERVNKLIQLGYR